MKHKIFGITGWKNNGKTTMTERIVSELTSRGYKIATIKHAHHDFDIDVEGTDSWRHRHAGAGEIAVVSANRWAFIHENKHEDEADMETILSHFSPCDLILVEGYKRENHDKLEIRREGGKRGENLSLNDPHIVAVASDMNQSEETLPVFDINDIIAISDFIENHMDLSRKTKGN